VKRLVVVGACLAAAPVHADPAQLEKQGEQLAKDGQFAEAIDAFKAADAERPTTELACLIGLAYGRRNLYAQAELFFDLCHERARSGKTGDPVPSWVAKVEAQFRERLESSRLARVTIKVKHGRAPKVVVSAFAPDETFAPRAIHLPPGRHTITVTDADGETAEKAIVVEGGEPQTVVLSLAGKEDVDPPEEPRSRAPSKLGRNLAFVGLGVMAAGLVVHATWYKGERDELQEASDTGDVLRYDEHIDSYTNARYVTIGLYSAGAVAAIVGLALHLSRDDGEGDAAVSVVPVRGGGVLAWEWPL
jgi:hypothetical protein